MQRNWNLEAKFINSLLPISKYSRKKIILIRKTYDKKKNCNKKKDYKENIKE